MSFTGAKAQDGTNYPIVELLSFPFRRLTFRSATGTAQRAVPTFTSAKTALEPTLLF
jgi:hypothetical protein